MFLTVGKEQPQREVTLNHTYSLSQFPLFPLLHGGQVVDCRVLYHRQEDEDKTDPEVNVHCLDVGDPRHGGVDPGNDGGHGQHGGDAWSEKHKQLNHARQGQTQC